MTSNASVRSPRGKRPEPRRTTPSKAGLWLVSGFAASAALLSGLTLYVLLAPTSGLAAAAPLSPPHEARAMRALGQVRDVTGLAEVAAETRLMLDSSPALAGGWLRLAYLEVLEHGRLTPAALAALKRSYEVAPLGPDVSDPRLRLVFGMWSQMPEDIRDQALDELKAAKYRDKPAAYALVGTIGDPAGRLAIGMGLAAIEIEAVRGWTK